jgi:hypothetical protein
LRGGDAAAGGAGCASHSCLDIGRFCDTTTVTFEAPGNVWMPGEYTLTVGFAGGMDTCTLSVPASPKPGASFTGTCSDPSVLWNLEAICPPKTWCEAGACAAMFSSSYCLPGQYEMTVRIGGFAPASGRTTSLFTSVTVDLAIGGIELAAGTVPTTTKTTQPNGEGCGYCTNATATVQVDAAGSVDAGRPEATVAVDGMDAH